MRKLRRDELIAALRAAGVAAGDVVHVQSDLLRIGLVDAASTRHGILQFYLDGFFEVLGRNGTLTVCTAFEDYGRYGTPFIREESPSRTDAFSEFVRTRPGAVRSMHPIVSVAGLGARAAEICGGDHYEGFGYESPWGRLHRANAKIMSLGLGSTLGGTTFFHYLETMYGVPYKYTKIYDAPVYSAGKEIPGPFTLSVRFLDFGIVNVPFRIKPFLIECGKAREIPIGWSSLWCCTAADIMDEGMKQLGRDRYFLLEHPPTFRRGELPMDGPTGEMRVHYDKALTADQR